MNYKRIIVNFIEFGKNVATIMTIVIGIIAILVGVAFCTMILAGMVFIIVAVMAGLKINIFLAAILGWICLILAICYFKNIEPYGTIGLFAFCIFCLLFMFWLCANIIINVIGLKINFIIAGILGIVVFSAIIIVNLEISDKVGDWIKEVKKSEGEKEGEA